MSSPTAADPSRPRFLLDAHLGKLAKYLRMLGFDSLWKDHLEDRELARLHEKEYRVLLTRDRRLITEEKITRGHLVQNTDPRLQLREISDRYRLMCLARPFTVCMECNGALLPVAKETVRHELKPQTAQFYDEFFRCSGCRRLYWKGHHYQEMSKLIESLSAHKE